MSTSKNLIVFRDDVSQLNEQGALEPTPYPLGRAASIDVRDQDYLVEDNLPQLLSTPTKTSKHWYAYYHHFNQGNTPQCVAYSGTHLLVDSPNPGRVTYSKQELYNECQRNDEWEGEDYAGTSVRALAKVLQRWGYIGAYYWIRDTEQLSNVVINKTPVVVGTYWTQGMFRPDIDDFIKPTGSNVGGHAYVINGVNLNKGYYRIKNSWGRPWGEDGHAKILIEDFAELLARRGEAMVATEIARKKVR